MADVQIKTSIEGGDEAIDVITRLQEALSKLDGLNTNGGGLSSAGMAIGGVTGAGFGGGYSMGGGGVSNGGFAGFGGSYSNTGGGGTGGAYASLPPMQSAGSDGFTSPSFSGGQGGGQGGGANTLPPDDESTGRRGGENGRQRQERQERERADRQERQAATEAELSRQHESDARMGAVSTAYHATGGMGGQFAGTLAGGAGIASQLAGLGGAFAGLAPLAMPLMIGAAGIGVIGAGVQAFGQHPYEQQQRGLLPGYYAQTGFNATRLGGQYIDPISQQVQMATAEVQGRMAQAEGEFDFGGSQFLPNILTFGGSKKYFDMTEKPRFEREIAEKGADEQYRLALQDIRGRTGNRDFDMDVQESPETKTRRLAYGAAEKSFRPSPGGVFIMPQDASDAANVLAAKKSWTDSQKSDRGINRQYTQELQGYTQSFGYFGGVGQGRTLDKDGKSRNDFERGANKMFSKEFDDSFFATTNIHTAALPGANNDVMGSLSSSSGTSAAYKSYYENGRVTDEVFGINKMQSTLTGNLDKLFSGLEMLVAQRIKDGKPMGEAEYNKKKESLFNGFFDYRDKTRSSDLEQGRLGLVATETQKMQLDGADPLTIARREIAMASPGENKAQREMLVAQYNLVKDTDPVQALQLKAQIEGFDNNLQGRSQGGYRRAYSIFDNRNEMKRDELGIRYQRDFFSGAGSDVLQGDIAAKVEYFDNAEKLIDAKIGDRAKLGLNDDDVRQLKNEKMRLGVQRDFGLKRDVFGQFEQDTRASMEVRGAGYNAAETQARLYGGVKEITAAGAASLETVAAEISLLTKALATDGTGKPMSDRERKETSAEKSRMETQLSESMVMLTRQMMSMQTGLAQSQAGLVMQGSERAMRYGVSGDQTRKLMQGDIVADAGSLNAGKAELAALEKGIRDNGGDPDKNPQVLAMRQQVGYALDKFMSGGDRLASKSLPLDLRESQAQNQFTVSALSMMPGSMGNIRGAQMGLMQGATKVSEDADADRAKIIETYGEISPQQQSEINSRKRQAGMEYAQAFAQVSYGWQNRLMSLAVNTPGSFSLVAPGLSYKAAVGAGVYNPAFGSNKENLAEMNRASMKVGSIAGSGSAEGLTLGGATGAGYGRGITFGGHSGGIMGIERSEHDIADGYGETAGRLGAKPEFTGDMAGDMIRGGLERAKKGAVDGNGNPMGADPRFIGYGAWGNESIDKGTPRDATGTPAMPRGMGIPGRVSTGSANLPHSGAQNADDFRLMPNLEEWKKAGSPRMTDAQMSEALFGNSRGSGTGHAGGATHDGKPGEPANVAEGKKILPRGQNLFAYRTGAMQDAGDTAYNKFIQDAGEVPVYSNPEANRMMRLRLEGNAQIARQKGISAAYQGISGATGMKDPAAVQAMHDDGYVWDKGAGTWALGHTKNPNPGVFGNTMSGTMNRPNAFPSVTKPQYANTPGQGGGGAHAGGEGASGGSGEVRLAPGSTLHVVIQMPDGSTAYGTGTLRSANGGGYGNGAGVSSQQGAMRGQGGGGR